MSVIVRQIQPEDQKQAFKIWSDGMSEDLGEYFFEHFKRKKRVWALITIIWGMCLQNFSFGNFLNGIFAVIIVFLILKFQAFMCQYNYRAMRTDINNIYENHKENFFVAERFSVDGREILGTIGIQRNPGQVKFRGEKIENVWEVFSLSVAKNERKSGIADKMMKKVEELAKLNNVGLFLLTATCQVPAIKFYEKRGFEKEEIPMIERKTWGGKLELALDFLLSNTFTFCLKKSKS